MLGFDVNAEKSVLQFSLHNKRLGSTTFEASGILSFCLILNTNILSKSFVLSGGDSE